MRGALAISLCITRCTAKLPRFYWSRHFSCRKGERLIMGVPRPSRYMYLAWARSCGFPCSCATWEATRPSTSRAEESVAWGRGYALYSYMTTGTVRGIVSEILSGECFTGLSSPMWAMHVGFISWLDTEHAESHLKSILVCKVYTKHFSSIICLRVANWKIQLTKQTAMHSIGTGPVLEHSHFFQFLYTGDRTGVYIAVAK